MKLSLILLATSSLIFVAPLSGQLDERTGAMNLDRVSAPLRAAGITLDEPSLIRALRNENKRIATSAALTLPLIARSTDVKKAIREAVRDEDDTLAISAMNSLLRMGEKDWVKDGLSRLPRLQGKIQQVLLARHLAEAGSVESWPFVLRAIVDGRWEATAFETIPLFIELQRKSGKRFVFEDLRGLEDQLPFERRASFRRRVGELRTRTPL